MEGNLTAGNRTFKTCIRFDPDIPLKRMSPKEIAMDGHKDFQ